MTKPVSPDFPYAPNFQPVLDSEMHYVERGEGGPVLFLHGNPTWSYLWRNILPYAAQHGRAIAVDLIGMGRSGKPDIEYRFSDHTRYLDAFIEALGLEDLTLVVHDWGSALGFDYARRHEGRVRRIAFMEAIVRPAESWDVFPAEMKPVFKAFRTPAVGWTMIAVQNLFVEKLLPRAVVRDLTDEEMDYYREPYPTVSSRKPVWRWPNEIPIEGKPEDVHQAVSDYADWLSQSEIPKLMFTADPGVLIPEKVAAWCRQTLPNLSESHLGQGIHYLQEDHPHEIGKELGRWLRST